MLFRAFSNLMRNPLEAGANLVRITHKIRKKRQTATNRTKARSFIDVIIADNGPGLPERRSKTCSYPLPEADARAAPDLVLPSHVN